MVTPRIFKGEVPKGSAIGAGSTVNEDGNLYIKFSMKGPKTVLVGGTSLSLPKEVLNDVVVSCDITLADAKSVRKALKMAIIDYEAGRVTGDRVPRDDQA